MSRPNFSRTTAMGDQLTIVPGFGPFTLLVNGQTDYSGEHFECLDRALDKLSADRARHAEVLAAQLNDAAPPYWDANYWSAGVPF